MQQNTLLALEQVIDRHPLTVIPEISLTEVIGLMQELSNKYNFADEIDTTARSNSSCVLIVENSQLQGIFTERDLVKLIAAGTNTKSFTIGEIMTRDVVSLTIDESQDIFSVLTLLRSHNIRHLPVVDNDNNLLGLITPKTLREKLQPINLMKWRKVQEVMEKEVIYATPDRSVRYIAQLMMESQTSYVAIGESALEPDNDSSFIRPLGIITERDIVQFQNLDLDLEQPAQNLMSTPLFLIHPEDTLWSVHQQMQQRRVRRLLVGDAKEALLGIVTQTSLLQIFDPTEMYGVIEALQQQVCGLEIEKTQLLASQQEELKQQVREQTSVLESINEDLLNKEEILRNKFKQQQAVAEFGQIALAEKNLAPILERAVNLVAATLDVEYCKVLELLPDGKNLLLKAGVGWHDGIVGTATVRADTNSQAGYTLLSAEPVIVQNLQQETRFIGPNLLLDHQVVSGMSIIIPDGERPFGILGVHTTQHRIFSQDDVNFIIAIANIIAQTNERQQAEAFSKESQERYILAVEGSSSGLWDWNVVTNEVFYAPRFKEIIGYSDREMSNVFEAWASKIHPDDCDRVLDAVQDHLKNHTPYDIEYRLLKKDNSYCWVQAKGQAIWNESSQPLRMAGSITDISDRKRRENILKDIASGVTISTGADFLSSLVEYLCKALKVDFAFIGQLIYPEKDKIKTLAVFGNGQIIDNFEYWKAGTPCQRVFENGVCIYPEAIAQKFPDDSMLRDISAESYAGITIVDSNGNNLGLIAVLDSKPCADAALTEEVLKIFATRAANELERQQAELALRQSEEKFRVIFDQSFQFIGLLEPDGKMIEANQTALDFVGLKPVDIRGKPFWETPWWSGSLQAQNLLQQGIAKAATGEFVRFEVEHPGTENRVVTVDFSLTPIKDETGKVIMLIPEGRNISDRKQAENKIREQAALLDIATDAIMVRSLDNQLLFWNQGAERLYGWTQAEALKGDAEKLLYKRSLSKLTEIQHTAIDRGEWQGELKQVTKSGKKILVKSRWTLVKDKLSNPESFLIVNTDITEQKQLEIQFLRTQRLESLGTLAGGIAHDLNNILAPILGFSKLLPLKLPNVDEQTKGFFKIMENNANRGTALVKQILTFSRGLEGERGIIQIRHLISEIAQIIRETFPKSIELETNVPKTLWTINADINQLHQVLMNLSVNARDAMPEGGKLTINAENIAIDAEYARLHLDATKGSYVLITVSDTGEGIPSEVIDRIFEPFFTTKEVGRGTGLGLSTVIGIIRSHDGFVEVTSDRQCSSRGTKFKVFLPASDIAENNIEEAEENLQGNGELVLVVDDETAILEVTKATLETYNYRVLTANNGMEAIATYANNKDEIAVVIMDIMMPGMDGKTAIRTLKKINPDVKVIAVSGLITSQEIVEKLGGNVTAFMSKPYTNDDLLKTLREIL